MPAARRKDDPEVRVDEAERAHEEEEREHRDLDRNDHPEEEDPEQPVAAREAQLRERVARHGVHGSRSRTSPTDARRRLLPNAPPEVEPLEELAVVLERRSGSGGSPAGRSSPRPCGMNDAETIQTSGASVSAGPEDEERVHREGAAIERKARLTSRPPSAAGTGRASRRGSRAKRTNAIAAPPPHVPQAEALLVHEERHRERRVERARRAVMT